MAANGAVVNKNFFEDPGVHKTLAGDGIATIIGGILGAPANTTYSENTGVLAVTGNYNPKIIRLAGILTIALSLFGKFSGFLSSIPSPVIGGISIMLFGMIAAIGLKTIIKAQVDFSNFKNSFIFFMIFVFATGVESIVIGGLSISGLTLAAIFGIVLNKILK
jgi:uracil permease